MRFMFSQLITFSRRHAARINRPDPMPRLRWY